jgi:hypothetical protein
MYELETLRNGKMQMSEPQSIDPKTVLSPKGMVDHLKVIHDGGVHNDGDPWSGWSLATLSWDRGPAVGIRWNGIVGEGVGSPQSRGIPTWMIVPDPLAGIAVAKVERHLRGEDTDDDEEAVSPRRQMLDVISMVRAASDEDLKAMIDQMRLKPGKAV